jgi:adenosylcobyric acid synthase
MTGRPVLGLVPFYKDILIDSEDSVAVQEDKRKARPVGPASVNIAVVRLPSISNFTDLEILEGEPDVVVNYLSHPHGLSGDYDCLILPGTKNAMEDAIWLSQSGWKKAIGRFVKGGMSVFGICGGYQLLGERIKDPWGVESDRREVKGLKERPPRGGRRGRFHQYDQLADHFEAHCDVERTLSFMGTHLESGHNGHEI